jgi:hypothetical protein
MQHCKELTKIPAHREVFLFGGPSIIVIDSSGHGIYVIAAPYPSVIKRFMEMIHSFHLFQNLIYEMFCFLFGECRGRRAIFRRPKKKRSGDFMITNRAALRFERSLFPDGVGNVFHLPSLTFNIGFGRKALARHRLITRNTVRRFVFFVPPLIFVFSSNDDEPIQIIIDRSDRDIGLGFSFTR